MKIAMVSEHANPLAALGGVDAGGQNLHVAELSAALVRAGHRVVVHTRRDDPDQPDEVLTPAGFTVRHVAAGPARPVPKDELLPYMNEFALRLEQDWLAEPPDVVHAHFWMSGLASVLAAKSAGVPVVQTFHALGVVKRRHQGDADTSPPDRIRIERMVGKHVARIAATCSDEVFELIRMGVPRSAISVAPCGVDLSRFTPIGPAEEKGARRRLVAVGRLVPRKGFSTVIAALRGVPDTELVIAGGEDGRDREAARLRWFAKRMGVADRVHLRGAVSREDMPALLRSADLAVCTPWYEPFGIVPLEAMACGVPVVAAAVGGLTDTVVDGVTGALVPPRQPGPLAAKLRELLADPTQLGGYSAAAVDRAGARYSWDRIAADTSRVYSNVLSATVPTPMAAGSGR